MLANGAKPDRHEPPLGAGRLLVPSASHVNEPTTALVIAPSVGLIWTMIVAVVQMVRASAVQTARRQGLLRPAV